MKKVSLFNNKIFVFSAFFALQVSLHAAETQTNSSVAPEEKLTMESVKNWKSVTMADGTTKSWEKVMHVYPWGFSFITDLGVGKIKFKDLPAWMQKDLGYTGAEETDQSSESKGSDSKPSAQPQVNENAYKVAAFQNELNNKRYELERAKAEIAQYEVDKAQAVQKGYADTEASLQRSIDLKKAKVQIMEQEAKVAQLKVTAQQLLDPSQAFSTGNPQADQIQRALQRTRYETQWLNVEKETLRIDLIRYTQQDNQSYIDQTNSRIQAYDNKIQLKQLDERKLQADLRAAQIKR